MFSYRASRYDCQEYSVKQNCITNKVKSKCVYRWEHESIIDTYTKKMSTSQAKEIVKKEVLL